MKGATIAVLAIALFAGVASAQLKCDPGCSANGVCTQGEAPRGAIYGL